MTKELIDRALDIFLTTVFDFSHAFK